MKDPAFLFYSSDFQSGTMDMSCSEVGAYIRLLVFQHQHEKIPNDKERLMRITGIFCENDFDSVWETIKTKFNQTDNHLVNERLNEEMEKRRNHKPKKIASAVLAGLISSNNLKKSQIDKVKKSFNISDFLEYKNDEIKEEIKKWFYNMVNQMVNNIENENENKDIIKEKGIGGMGEKEKTGKEKSYERFNEWIDTKIPYLRKIRDQITFEEYCRLTEKYNGDQIRRVLTDMSNYKDSPKKYVSVNLTFQNWAKKEYG